MKKIYFRADANPECGYGHFIRTLALADILKDKFSCKFFTSSPSTYQIQEMQKVCPFVALEEDGKLESFVSFLKGDEIVVLDNYFFSDSYQQQIRNIGCKVVYVGDFPEVNYVADVVLAPFLSEDDKLHLAPYTKVYRDLDWALLRKPFLHPNLSIKEDNSWLISFGGSDYLNLTEKYLKILQTSPDVKKITVVVGDAYKYAANLTHYAKATIKKNISAEEMAYEMSVAEYAVLPCSGVCVEAFACGCKIVSGYYVDNQEAPARLWEKYGYILNVGDMTSVSQMDFIEKVKLLNTSKVDFGSLASRYVELFEELSHGNA